MSSPPDYYLTSLSSTKSLWIGRWEEVEADVSSTAVEWTVDGMETQNAAAVNLHSATGNAYNVAGWGWARAVGTILGDHGRHDAHQLQLASHRPLSLARKKSLP